MPIPRYQSADKSLSLADDLKEIFDVAVLTEVLQNLQELDPEMKFPSCFAKRYFDRRGCYRD